MTAPTHTIVEAPYRVDVMVRIGDADRRAGYALMDGYGWHIKTGAGETRVNGHTRAARAAVRAVLGGAE